MSRFFLQEQSKKEESKLRKVIHYFYRKLFGLNPESGKGFRFAILVFCIVSLFGTFGVKLTHIALNPSSETNKQVNLKTEFTSRGSILDRNGRLLAVNIPGYAIYAHPNQISKDQIDGFLEELQNIKPPIKFDLVETRKNLFSNKKFIWISNKVSSDQSQAVNRIAIKGVRTGQREIRVYPNGNLASHILGGVKFGEQHSNKAEILGIAGAERYFNDQLNDPTAVKRDVYLSIDINAQNVITNLMRAGVDYFDAKGGSAILMNVHSGEILAMVSLPDFDPINRNFAKKQNPESLFNRSTQGVYEMGSTFKLFTMTQALDNQLVDLDTIISVDPISILNKTFKDYRSHDEMPIQEAFERSKNTAVIRLAKQIGRVPQRNFFIDLGFDKKVTIELPEKETPLFPSEKDWTKLTMATVSFGHGVSISPLHLAKAYAVIVNGGREIQTTIVKSQGSKKKDQIISPEASRKAIQLLQAVVNNGTASATDIEGYMIGGKTGTSEKVGANGKYLEDKNMVTFASVFPGKNPNYVMVVRLDEATTNRDSKHAREAGNTVVPLTKEIISRLIPILGIKPIAIEEEPIQMVSK